VTRRDVYRGYEDAAASVHSRSLTGTAHPIARLVLAY
jgi:hypothetical protein